MSIVIWETKDVLECPPAPAQCAFPTGQSVLDYLEFEGGDGELWLNTLVLVSRGFRNEWGGREERNGKLEAGFCWFFGQQQNGEIITE